MSNLNFKKTEVYTKVCNDVTVMVIFRDDREHWEGEWEIYYSKQGHPFQFAFGLPGAESFLTVFFTAVNNIDEYRDLFDDYREGCKS